MYYGTTCCAPGTTACSAGYPPVICCPDGTLCAVDHAAGKASCGAPASSLALLMVLLPVVRVSAEQCHSRPGPPSPHMRPTAA